MVRDQAVVGKDQPFLEPEDLPLFPVPLFEVNEPLRLEIRLGHFFFFQQRVIPGHHQLYPALVQDLRLQPVQGIKIASVYGEDQIQFPVFQAFHQLILRLLGQIDFCFGIGFSKLF